MIRLPFLRRSPEPPSAPPAPRTIPPQPAHEKDWAVGDRGECIASGDWREIGSRAPAPGPDKGAVVRVIGILADDASVWLRLAGFSAFFYPAGHFRKLRPCATDFREQLRQRAPISVPAIREPELTP